MRAPLIAPRTECGCQPVASTISSMVAPFLRLSSSIISACLVPGRTAGGGVLSFGLEPEGLRTARRLRCFGCALVEEDCLLVFRSTSTPIACRPASAMTRAVRP